MDSPSRIPVMPTSNFRSRVLGNSTPPAAASPSRIPVMPTSNVRSRVLDNRPPPAMITQADKRETRHSRRSTSFSSLGQSLAKNISKILPKNRKEKGGTHHDVEDLFVENDKFHISTETTQLKKKRAVIADLVDHLDGVVKKPEKSACRVLTFTGSLGLSWINRRNSFEWERTKNGATGESQLEPKKGGTFKKLWGSLKHHTGNTAIGLNMESRGDEDVDVARASIIPSELTNKNHIEFTPDLEVNNAVSDVIIIASTGSITADKRNIVVTQPENITAEKIGTGVAQFEHIRAEKSDVAVALNENISEKSEKRVRHEERRSFRQSDDYLGVQGANPQTGFIDSSPVISSTEVSEEDAQGTFERSSRLAEATRASLATVHETRRQTKLEARLKQEKINRTRRVKLDTRNLGFRQKAQESGRWRSSDGHWSYQPALIPVKERKGFIDNRQLKQTVVDDQQPYQSIADGQTPQQSMVDNQDPQQSIVDDQKLKQSIVHDQKLYQTVLEDQKLQQSTVDDEQPQKIIVQNRQSADETVDTYVERTSFLSLPTPPESPKCATTIICTSTIGFYVQELPAMNLVRDDKEDIADHSAKLNQLLKEGRGDIADHSFDLTMAIMKDIETIHGLMECISIEGIEAVDIERIIEDLETIQDIMKEFGVIHPSVIDLEAVNGSVIDEKVDLEVMKTSFIDEESIMMAFEEIEMEVVSEVHQVEDHLLEFIFVHDIIIEDNVVEEIILENFDVMDVDVENSGVKLIEFEDIDVEDILNAFDIVDSVMGDTAIKSTSPATISLVEEKKRYDIADHFADFEVIEMKDLVRGGLIGGMVIAAAALGAYVLKSH